MTIWQKRLDLIQSGTSPLPPVVEHLRLGRLTSWGDGFIEKTWDMDPTFATGDGSGAIALFGGYMGALADQAAAFAAMTMVPDDQYFRTSDLRISFFRSVRAGSLHIRADVVHRSKTLLHIDVNFSNEKGELLARAHAVQSLLAMNEQVVQAMQEAMKVES